MIPGPEAEKKYLSDVQREDEAARNSNITTWVTGVTKIVDEVPQVVKDKERDSEVETENL